MMEFIKKVKEVEINGVSVVIRRREVPLFYLLLIYIHRMQKEPKNFEIVKSIVKEFYSIKVTGLNSLLYKVGIKKFKDLEILEIVSEVIEFNTVKSKSFDRTSIPSENEINNRFYYMITQIMFYTSMSLEEILNLDYVTLHIIFNNLRFLRYNNAVDVAFSYDLKSFKRLLQI